MMQGVLRAGADKGVGRLPVRLLGLAALFSLGGAVSAAAQARTDIGAMCGARKPCTLVKATPAGMDAQGRALTIVELNLGPKNPDDEQITCTAKTRAHWAGT